MFRWFTNYKTSEEIRIRFIFIYGMFGGLALGTYAVINLLVGDYPFFVFELILSAISFLLIYVVIKNNNSEVAINWGFLPIMAISITNFAYGGFNDTGIYWTYILPLVVIYISGIKRGTYINVAYLAICSIYFLASREGYLTERYSDIEFFTYIFSFSAVSFMAGLFYISWNLNDTLLNSQKIEIEKSKIELENRLNELNLTKTELETSLEKTKAANEELRKINQLVVNREMKMVELKEELDELKK